MVRYSRYFSQTQLVDLPSLKCTCAFIGAGYWGAAVRVADGTPGSVVLALWYSNSAVGKNGSAVAVTAPRPWRQGLRQSCFPRWLLPPGFPRGLLLRMSLGSLSCELAGGFQAVHSHRECPPSEHPRSSAWHTCWSPQCLSLRAVKEAFLFGYFLPFPFFTNNFLGISAFIRAFVFNVCSVLFNTQKESLS